MEWLERTELLLGRAKLDRLRQANVLIVGLGGVGAYAAEMICRAGVGSMTIADADTVSASNINRQARRPYFDHRPSQNVGTRSASARYQSRFTPSYGRRIHQGRSDLHPA